jgi:site-specific DNA recombinase
VLVEALYAAHALLSMGAANPLGEPEAATLSRAPSDPYERRLLCLAFLAPDIQRDILEGRQPAGLSLQRLILGGIPASWDDQRAEFR